MIDTMPGSYTSSTRGWQEYLDAFHAARSGITEAILSVATASDGITPYGWLVDALPDGGTVLDLACGSGPLFSAMACSCEEAPHPTRRVIGIDRSPGELGRAQCQEAILVRGDAASLPFVDSSFPALSCSMALMLVASPNDVVEEVTRVLDPGGIAVFLLPGSRPLGLRDVWRYGRAMASLRMWRPAYPNQIHRTGLTRLLRRAGLEILDDQHRRFDYRVIDEESARRFVESLYTPGCQDEWCASAVRSANKWIGSMIGIPLRRVVCRMMYGSG